MLHFDLVLVFLHRHIHNDPIQRFFSGTAIVFGQKILKISSKDFHFRCLFTWKRNFSKTLWVLKLTVTVKMLNICIDLCLKLTSSALLWTGMLTALPKQTLNLRETICFHLKRHHEFSKRRFFLFLRIKSDETTKTWPESEHLQTRFGYFEIKNPFPERLQSFCWI